MHTYTFIDIAADWLDWLTISDVSILCPELDCYLI